MITKEKITEHHELNSSIRLVWDIMDDFDGYVCHRPHLCPLPIKADNG